MKVRLHRSCPGRGAPVHTTARRTRIKSWLALRRPPFCGRVPCWRKSCGQVPGGGQAGGRAGGEQHVTGGRHDGGHAASSLQLGRDAKTAGAIRAAVVPPAVDLLAPGVCGA
eukprot:jgi/Tetstr1/457063/TSEL_043725.t1